MFARDRDRCRRRASATGVGAMPSTKDRYKAGGATLRGRAGRFARDEGGAAVILAAFLFPVVIGGLGLGAETGYWYLEQREVQHAADVAAHAAGMRKRAGDSIEEYKAAALQVATQSGFTAGSGSETPASFEVNSPPAYSSDPSITGNAQAVEVVLRERVSRLFSSIFDNTPITLESRAVALLGAGSSACVLALSPTASSALSIAGSASVALTGCSVASNSNASNALNLQGTSARLSADCAYTVGQAVVTTGVTLSECDAVQEFSSPTVDPYADLAEPNPAQATCINNQNVGQPLTETTVTPTETLSNGVRVRRYCKGLQLQGTVTFEPGLYIIEGGDMTAPGDAIIQGTGVTFYFPSTGSLKLNASAKLDLSAPTSGPYAGILFFGARDATTVTHQINGTADSTLDGAIYAPASTVSYAGGGSTAGGCTQIVANTVSFSGSSNLASVCSAAGTRDIVTNQTVTLVE